MKKRVNKVLNIAVIDDDILALRLFRDNLERIGFGCKIYNNPDTALNDIDKFDVVMLDYHLGRVNGKDLLKKIKAVKEDIVTIMISGYMIQNIVNRDMKDQLYAFYTKPVDFEKLKADLDAISASLKDRTKL